MMDTKKFKDKLIFGTFKFLARLPLTVLYLFADIITLVLYHVVKYRRKVVRENLVSSFPAESLRQIKKIERAFYRYLGDQMVETLKLLHISDKELQRRVTVKNYDLVNESLSSGRNAVLFMGHYGNWEWAQEITRYFVPQAFMASIYHPLNDPLWDEIFIEMRSRWGAHIVPMTKAPRVLISKQNQPWVCGFIADAWTWHKNEDNWLWFLNHKTWFIYGSEEIGKKVGADFFYLEMVRTRRGHYEIIFSTLVPEENEHPFPYTREFYHRFEETIKKNPALWLWSHKRWK